MKKRCLLDLDGVLIDLLPSWVRHHGLKMPEVWPVGEYDLTSIFPISGHAIWDGCSADWWADLPWTADGRLILSIVERHFQEGVCLVSLPSTPEGAAGKMRWIHKHLNHYARRYLLGPARMLLASNETILIDDMDANVESFTREGGHGILLPRLWNSNHSKANQTLSALESKIYNTLDGMKAR